MRFLRTSAWIRVDPENRTGRVPVLLRPRDDMPQAFLENTCLPYLLGAQNEDGGWGFRAHSASRAEPTAWALIALAESTSASTPAHADASTRALQFLHATQLPDGSWPCSPGLPEGSWVTSLACLALLGRDQSSENGKRGLDRLCQEMPGETGTLRRIMRSFATKKKDGTQDESYFGWSWTAGTSSWVEPTSYAMILLHALPQAMLPAAAANRMQMGEAMLYNRMCPGGGWNCGNPMVYGVPGEPQITSTVWGLLALKPHPERTEVQQSLQWLQGKVDAIQSPVSLALSIIAMSAYGKPSEELAQTLQSMHEKNEILWNVPEVSWSALALSGTAQNWLKTKSGGSARGSS